MDTGADSSATAKPKHSRKPLLILLSALVVYAVSICGLYAYFQNEHTTDQTSSTAEISSLNAQLSAAKKMQKPATFSQKMPNGKTISYPLTAENASVVWWYGGRDSDTSEPNGTYIYVSTLESIQFVSEINSDYLQNVCGAGSGLLQLADINHWAITTSTKQLSHGNGASCLQLLADSRFDSTGKYRARAQQVLADEQQTFNNFVKSITIQ